MFRFDKTLNLAYFITLFNYNKYFIKLICLFFFKNILTLYSNMLIYEYTNITEVLMLDFNNKEETKKILAEKAELFKNIAHPARLCILAMLIKEEQSNVTDIQCCLDIPQPTISQHLAKLKAAGILTAERNGTEIIYKFKNEEIKKLILQILED